MFFEATYDTRATLCLFEMNLLGKISEQMLKSILGPLFIKCESPRGPLSREKYTFVLFWTFSVLFDQKIWVGALINILLQPSFRPGITGRWRNFFHSELNVAILIPGDQEGIMRKGPVTLGFDTFGTLLVFNQTKGWRIKTSGDKTKGRRRSKFSIFQRTTTWPTQTR